jgi:hypothetical protein
MALDVLRGLTVSLALVLASGTAAPAQEAPPEAAAADAGASRETQRQEILESARWREAQRKFDEWLSIQQIYSPEEVAALRADLAARVAAMSPEALTAFLSEMEDRLTVLLSPDAQEAREWIAEILAVARDPQSHFGGPLPDVANMTASEIRAELARFQQRRASRRQAQAAFDRGRERQVQSAHDFHAERSDALAQPRTAATFVEPSYRSPYAPRREPRRAFTGPPVYRVGPWGEPIYWNPLNDWHPWVREW